MASSCSASEPPGGTGATPPRSQSISSICSTDLAATASMNVSSTRKSGALSNKPRKNNQQAQAVRGPDILSPEQELEVIKAILLRESYLVRLRQLEDRTRKRAEQAVREANRAKGDEDIYLSMPPEMMDLLDLLRTSTVEAVEAIRRWKLAKRDTNSPYMWNGQNYLARIPTDLDFLRDFKPLMNWLRFDMLRNPFIIPRPMLGVEAEVQGGAREVIGAFEPAFLQCERVKVKPPRPQPSPYLTPIINDLDLLPAPKHKLAAAKPGAGQQQPRSSTFTDPSLKHLTVRPDDELHPRVVLGEEEVVRVRKAEQAILDEERAHGRYSRKGAELVLLQAGEATETGEGRRQRRPSVKTAGGRSSTMDGASALPVSSEVRRAEEASVRAKGTSALEQEQGQEEAAPGDGLFEEFMAAYTDNKKRYHTPRLPMDAPDDPPSLKRARKMGSDLFLLTVAGTSGRMKPLARPTRFMRAEHDMDYLRAEIADKLQAAYTMQQQVEALQHELFPLGLAGRRAGEDTRSGDTDDEEEGRSMVAAAEELRARLRVECGQMWGVIEGLRYEARWLQAELDFKAECRAYLQQVQRIEADRQAAELQRARVRLRDGEVLPEDEHVAMGLEDASATRIQARVRGMITRPWVKRHHLHVARLVTRVQAAYRGHMGRKYARDYARRRRAAVKIQSVWRSSRLKHLLATLRVTRARDLAARPIQRFLRAYLARRRVMNRRVFVSCARGALESVNHKGLIPEDLVELADRLLATLTDPAEAFPPPALLGLLRLIAFLLATPECPDLVTHYNLLGARSQHVVTTMELTWSNAMRMLYRTKRLLRKLRSLASDPLRSPPRVLYFPPECLQLAAELRKDPFFSEQAMAAIGTGARCAAGLLRYYECLERVYRVQQHFTPTPSDCIPVWLARFRKQQKKRRMAHLQTSARRAAVERARSAVDARLAAELHFGAEKQALDDEVTALTLAEHKVLGRVDACLDRLERQLHETGQAQLQRLTEEKKHLERMYHIVVHERVVAEGDALSGSSKARAALPGLRVQEYRAEEALLAKVNDMQVCSDANDLHEHQSRQGERTYPSALLEAAEAMGRVQADLQVAQNYRAEFVTGIGGRYYIPSLQGQQLADYTALNERVMALSRESLGMMTRLQEESSRYEQAIHEVDVATVMDDIQAKRWDRPTPTQAEQEAKEDEARARAESEAMQRFLPPSLAEQLSDHYLGPEGGALVRTRPLLVVVARDCPLHVKRQVLSFLDAQFPAMFRHFGHRQLVLRRACGDDATLHAEEPPHLDVWPYQSAFMDGQHVTVELDVGSSYATRRAFLAAIFSLKNGLNPSPRCILILGGPRDKQGLGCHWDERVMPEELSSLTDRSLKSQLQLINEYLFDLAQPPAQLDLRALLSHDEPPSDRRLPPVSYVLVMKVVLILLSPLLHPRGPLATNPALVWQAARLLLRRRTDLASRLQAVQFHLIDPDTLASLEEYVADSRWPQRRQLSMQEDPVLMCLSQWAALMLDYHRGLREKAGGVDTAVPAMLKSDTFEAVVSIVGRQPEGPTQLRLSEALPYLARLVAQDTRVHVDVIRIDSDSDEGGSGGALRVVQCYQFRTRVLLTLYDPSSSAWDYCFVDMARIGKLLEPNFTDMDNFVVKYPPKSLPDVYRQLIGLLKYNTEWVRGERVRRLVCERAIDPLFESTRRVSGHRIHLLAFEDAKGELSFQIRAPDLGRDVYRCTVDFGQLTQLYWHGDRQLEAPFIHMLGAGGVSTDDSDDADEQLASLQDVVSTMAAVLHPIMDRLVILPTALSCHDGAIPAFRTSSRVGRPTTDPPPSLLTVRLRKGGGPGRLLFRRPFKLYRRWTWAPFHVVLSVLECGGPGGLLRVQAYDVDYATTYEFRVGRDERALLLPPVQDGYLTFTEDDEARALPLAVRQRIRVGEQGELVWDVSVRTTAKEMPEPFGTTYVSAGLDPRKQTLEVRVEVPDRQEERQACLPLTMVAELAGGEGGGGLDVPGMTQCFMTDPHYREALVAWAEDMVQVWPSTMGQEDGASWPSAQTCLGLAYGDQGWIPLLTDPPETTEQLDAQPQAEEEGAQAAEAPAPVEGEGGWEQQAVSEEQEAAEAVQDAEAASSEGAWWGAAQAEPDGAYPSDVGPGADENAGDVYEQQAAEAAPTPQPAQAEHAPQLIKSMWEKRLVERVKTVIPVIEESIVEDDDEEEQQGGEAVAAAASVEREGEGGSMTVVTAASTVSSSLSSSAFGQVEVRVWECFTGGARSLPDQVYRVMVIDRVRRGVATISISGSKRVPQLVGVGQEHLLEPCHQKALVRHLVQHCLRLNVLDMGYKKVFSLGLKFPPPRPEPPPPTIRPPDPGPNLFSLSGLPTTLVLSETRRISGLRCRLLGYLLAPLREKGEGCGRSVAYIAVIRQGRPLSSLAAAAAGGGGVGDLSPAAWQPASAAEEAFAARAGLMVPLRSLLEPLGLEEGEVVEDKKGLREVVRTVGSFLRFEYDGHEEQGDKPRLVLPYHALRLQPRPAVSP